MRRSRFERQHVAALLSQARQHLAQIDAALLRLAEGSYGRCENCGRPIGAARLAARPVTTTCIDCASQRCASVTAAFAAAYPDIGGAGSLAKPHDPSVQCSALNIAPDHGAAGQLADRRLASAA